MTEAAPLPPPAVPPGPAARAAWCLYDWATQGFPTVITTFVFAAYFTKAVRPDDLGPTLWTWTMGGSALLVALLAPVLGAIADRSGRRKPWIGAFTVVCIAAAGLLWFVEPDARFAALALLLLGLGNFAFEMANVFYNAMLKDLVPPTMIGRLSGWGFGAGYIGGVACLLVALFVLIEPSPPLFGLDAAAQEPVRATAILVALWFTVFSIPFFLFTPDRPSAGLRPVTAAREGLATLIATLGRLGSYRVIVWFLVARLFYVDGLTTLFAVGGIYAGREIGMSFDEIILFAIGLNVTAGIGAVGFGWLDDWIGPKKTVLISLVCLIVLGSLILVSTEPLWFWAFALPLGLFFGPVQSASRSIMARLAPAHLQTEMFGLFALSGKVTAPVGPWVFGAVAALAGGALRPAMATIIVFFVVGLILLLFVRDERI